MADDVERTEDPTPKRRADAEKEGQIAISQDAFIFANLTAVTLVLLWLGNRPLQHAAVGFRTVWEPRGDLSVPEATTLIRAAFGAGIAVVTPILLAALASGIGAGLAQTRGALSYRKARFRLGKISPAQNWKRLLKTQGPVDLVKSLAKVALVGGLSGTILWVRMEDYLGLSQLPLILSARYQMESLILAFLMGCAGLFLIASIDYAYQSFRTLKQLRMSRQEVKEERKQSEGDPMVRTRMRSLQYERARARMMDAVPKADVVVTNPDHYSVALVYERGEMGAPKVLAKGRGLLALKIREVARRFGVPVVENPPLARSLYRSVKVGHLIPERLFQAVAEVLAYVHRLDPRRARRW